MTLDQCAISLCTSVPNASGEPPPDRHRSWRALAPCRSDRFLLMAVLSWPTTGAGVPFHQMRPSPRWRAWDSRPRRSSAHPRAGNSLASHDRERTQLARLDQLHDRQNGYELIGVDATDKVAIACGNCVGHVRRLHPVSSLNNCRADAPRTKLPMRTCLSGSPLEERNQFRNRMDRNRRVDHQDVIAGTGLDQRREVCLQTELRVRTSAEQPHGSSHGQEVCHQQADGGPPPCRWSSPPRACSRPPLSSLLRPTMRWQ